MDLKKKSKDAKSKPAPAAEPAKKADAPAPSAGAAAVAEPKKSKFSRILKGTGITLIVAAVFVVILFVFTLFTAYRSPVENIAKGINRGDYERILDSLYPENYVSALRISSNSNGLSWDEYIKKNGNQVDATINGMGISRVKVDFIAKEKMSGSNFQRIEGYYEHRYDADVKKAYRLEVEFTVKENGQKLTQRGWLCVVKVKKEGWKLCPQKSDDRFSFIDAVVNIT